MNKALPSITESPEQLHQQMRTEPDRPKRVRLHALYLLASGQATSRRALAQFLAVHRHTVAAWLTLYETGGLAALLTLKKAPGKPSSLSPYVLYALKQRLAQPQGFSSYGEIQRSLADTHRLPLSYSTVHALVRYKLRAKPKAPRRSHPKKNGGRKPLSAHAEHSAPEPAQSAQAGDLSDVAGMGTRRKPLRALAYCPPPEHRPRRPTGDPRGVLLRESLSLRRGRTAHRAKLLSRITDPQYRRLPTLPGPFRGGRADRLSPPLAR